MRYWQSCASRSSAEHSIPAATPALLTGLTVGVLTFTGDAGRSTTGFETVLGVGLILGVAAKAGWAVFTGSALDAGTWDAADSSFPGQNRDKPT
jgi:hypothetical protein